MAYDARQAAYLGSFIDAAYKMFERPNDPHPLQPEDHGELPLGHEIIAWINMEDFYLGRRFWSFYGLLLKKPRTPQM